MYTNYKSPNVNFINGIKSNKKYKINVTGMRCSNAAASKLSDNKNITKNNKIVYIGGISDCTKNI